MLIRSLVLATMLCSTVAHAGDVCKKFKVEEDKFGGGTHVTAVVQRLGGYRAVGIFLEVKNGKAELVVQVKESGALDGVVPVGVELPLLLKDGEVLTLSTVRETAMKSYVVETSILTNVVYALGIDDAQLAKLEAAPLETIRLKLSTGDFDWDANGGVQKTLVGAATCARKHLN